LGKFIIKNNETKKCSFENSIELFSLSKQDNDIDKEKIIEVKNDMLKNFKTKTLNNLSFPS